MLSLHKSEMKVLRAASHRIVFFIAEMQNRIPVVPAC